MTLKLNKVATLIYLTFALDSALKLNFGFQVHIGVALILLINTLTLLTKPSNILLPMLKELPFFVFCFYTLVNGFLFFKPGFSNVIIYLLLAVNVLIYCRYTNYAIDNKTFYAFQVILILTGLIQYLVFKFFNYQLSFIDAEHYQKGSSVSHRLRGFFVEPNWYSIALTFNTLLLIGKDVSGFIKNNLLIFVLTLLTFVLNGTLTTVGILFIIYTLPYIRKAPVKGVIITLLFLMLVVSVFLFRESINQRKDNSSALNHSSRVIPFMRVLDDFEGQSFSKVLTGNGLGSWGTEGVRKRLSVLVFEEDANARDGSELPVFIDELGLIGIILILFDSIWCYMRIKKDDIHIKGGIFLFVVCLLFYPTFKFWMYMPYYFYIRSYTRVS